MATDLEEQFERGWLIFAAQFEASAARETFGAAPLTTAAAAYVRAILDDAKPFMRRIALGEAPGLVILDMSKRHIAAGMSEEDARRLIDGAPRSGAH
jgi:hypothetical protein